MHPPEEPMKRPDIRLYQEFGIIKTCRSGRTPTSMTRMRINVGADGRSQTGSGFPRRLCTSAHDWRVISSLFTLFTTTFRPVPGSVAWVRICAPNFDGEYSVY